MKIRSANSDDVPLIYSYVQKKASFDRTMGAFSGTLTVSEAKLQKSLFGVIPFSYVVFVELNGKEIAFALYAFRYSSFKGQPSIWLDDLYVDEDIRSQGVGEFLMKYLARIATENDCSHLGWNADIRNIRGIKFYNRLGAEIVEQQQNRCFFKWIPYLKPLK